MEISTILMTGVGKTCSCVYVTKPNSKKSIRNQSLSMRRLSALKSTQYYLFPVKFQFDQVPKTRPKRSMLARLNNQNYSQKTNFKWSILDY